MDNQEKDNIIFSENKVCYQYLCKKEKYEMSFCINNNFFVQKCNASEIEMLCIYNKLNNNKYITFEPYIAVVEDNIIYKSINDYLSGNYDVFDFVEKQDNQFMFKAQKDYYGDLIYFYVFEKKDYFKGYSGLCLVYPRQLLNTGIEQELHSALDKVAKSFEQRKCNDEEIIINDFPLSINLDTNTKTIILTKSLDVRGDYYKKDNILFNRIIKDASTLFLMDTIKNTDDKTIQTNIDFDKKVIRVIMPNVSVKKSQLEQIQLAKEYVSKEYNMTLILSVTNY